MFECVRSWWRAWRMGRCAGPAAAELIVEAIEMAEIKALTLEVGQTRRIRVSGRTRSGKPHDLEGITATIVQNADAFQVFTTPNPDEFLVRCAAEGQSVLEVDADGHIGDGVKPVAVLLPLVGVAEDAASAVFEDLGDDAEPAVDPEGGNGEPVA